MRNSDIIRCYKGLEELRENNQLRLSAPCSFAIVRNMRALANIVEEIQLAYDDIIKQYADPVDGQIDQFKIKQQYLQEFQNKTKALDNLETDVQITKIPFSEIDKLHLTLSEMDALYFMIEEDKQEET